MASCNARQTASRDTIGLKDRGNLKKVVPRVLQAVAGHLQIHLKGAR